MSDINGSSWKNERYFSSYEEASMLKESLLVRFGGDLAIKIKRCGENGSLYVVKSREVVKEKTVEEPVKEKKVKKERQ